MIVREKAGTSVSPSATGKFDVIDVCLVVALGLLTLAVHDVPYLLRHPFWVDEAWVADTIRARIGLTPSLAASTPVGWALLLRLVPFGGAQRLRLMPLAFAMLAAATGYLFGRELRLTRYTTGILTGAGVLLSPAMLVRDDLKQYTAEAFAFLALWVLVARVENEWHLRRLVAIAATTCIGLFIANTVIFAGIAAMGSLALECVVKRNYRRLVELVSASAGMVIVSLAVFEVIDRRQITQTLVSYWKSYYVPMRSPSAAISFIYLRLHDLAPYMGFRFLALDMVLALAGIAGLIWLRRFALAAMVPMTVAIVIAASADRRYPFGDLRTSTFWLVAVPVLMAVAVAAAGRWAARMDRRLPLIAAALALAVWVTATATYIRSHDLPDENVRSQVAYVSAHVRPGDVILVGYAASYAFAYYYQANPSFPADSAGPNGHIPAYPGVRSIVVMTNRRAADVANALAAARARAAALPGGSRGRIWIIRSHQTQTEIQAWHRELAGARTTVIHVGHDPLLVYLPS